MRILKLTKENENIIDNLISNIQVCDAKVIINNNHIGSIHSVSIIKFIKKKNIFIGEYYKKYPYAYHEFILDSEIDKLILFLKNNLSELKEIA